MEAKSIINLIESVANEKRSYDKGFLKSLITNKYVLGSALIVSGMTAINHLKGITVDSALFSLIPRQLFGIAFGGIPIGGASFKLLEFSIVGTAIAEVARVVYEIKQGKTKASIIIAREGISVIAIIYALHLLGKLSLDILSSISNIVIPTF